MDLTESFEKTITGDNVERWRYPRFFTESITDSAVISGDDAKHIGSVLRMKSGDKAILCDGSGNDFLSRIVAVDKGFVEFEVLDSCKNTAEPSVKLRLFQCMPKADKMEFITQKAVELGASEIIPVISKRCVSRPDDKSAVKKVERLQKIAYEAAKQCGRGIIPQVGSFVGFKDALKLVDKQSLGLLFYECGGKALSELDYGKKSIDVFIGSEGGFDEDEVKLADSHGILRATLGTRILRCETAPIAAISILMNLTGNM